MYYKSLFADVGPGPHKIPDEEDGWEVESSEWIQRLP